MTLRSPSHRIAPTAAERPSKALTAAQAPCSGDNPMNYFTTTTDKAATRRAFSKTYFVKNPGRGLFTERLITFATNGDAS